MVAFPSCFVAPYCTSLQLCRVSYDTNIMGRVPNSMKVTLFTPPPYTPLRMLHGHLPDNALKTLDNVSLNRAAPVNRHPLAAAGGAKLQEGKSGEGPASSKPASKKSPEEEQEEHVPGREAELGTEAKVFDTLTETSQDMSEGVLEKGQEVVSAVGSGLQKLIGPAVHHTEVDSMPSQTLVSRKPVWNSRKL